jgi:hypothetical protein
LALPKVWQADAGHRKAYSCGPPAPFSTVSRCRRRMKPITTSRNSCLLPLATSLCVSRSTQPVSPAPQGHPYPTTLELSATLLLSRWGAALFCASPGRRETYPRSIEFA